MRHFLARLEISEDDDRKNSSLDTSSVEHFIRFILRLLTLCFVVEDKCGEDVDVKLAFGLVWIHTEREKETWMRGV